MFNSILAATLIVSLTLVSDIQAVGKWEKHGVDKGIAVYTTSEPQSEVPTVKAEAVVNASSKEVWKYISESMAISGLKERRTVGSCGEGCDYVYVRMGNWMITDRHYVARIESRVTHLAGHPKYVREWKKTNEVRVPNKKAIVVRSIRGSWTLTPVSRGTKTRVTYVNHLDLGGNVPTGIFSKGFISKAYDIVANVKKNS